MAHVIQAASDPGPRARSLLVEVAQGLERYASQPNAPAWVRALELAKKPPSGPHLAPRYQEAVRGVPRAHFNVNDEVGTAFIRQPENHGLLPQNAREFARSNEWVRTAINKHKGRVSKAQRAIVPINPNLPWDEQLQREITYLIENPNPKGESWRGFIEPPVEDLMTLGKGGWEYVPNWRGWPVALNAYDAAFMKILPSWDGSDPKRPRYQWGPPQLDPVGLRNDEITMILLNPSTFRTEGLSPIETLYNSIEADAAGNEFVRSMMKRYPPPGWFNLGRIANPKVVRNFTEKLQNEVFGRGGAMVTGGIEKPEFINLWQGNSRDNELMAWSLYFARKICAVFSISPQDLGITLDINRSNSDVQAELSQEDGYKTSLLLVEEYINRETVFRYGPPEEINLAFRFTELSMRERIKMARYLKDLMGGIPLLMLNEGRKEIDLAPLELGNAIYVESATGIHALIGDDAEAWNRQRASEIAAQEDAQAQDKGKPGKTTTTPDKKPEPTEDDKNAAAKETSASIRATVPARFHALFDRERESWRKHRREQADYLVAGIQARYHLIGPLDLSPTNLLSLAHDVLPIEALATYFLAVQLHAWRSYSTLEPLHYHEDMALLRERALSLATRACEVWNTLLAGALRGTETAGPAESLARVRRLVREWDVSDQIATAITESFRDLCYRQDELE